MPGQLGDATVKPFDILLLSIVVPAYNEQEVLPEFHRRTAAVLDGLPMQSEVVYVNDGSKDRTLQVLRELRAQDARVGIVDLSRNFGKEIALTAGLDAARGDAVVVIGEYLGRIFNEANHRPLYLLKGLDQPQPQSRPSFPPGRPDETRTHKDNATSPA